jgi:MarR family transcriptional regulator, transcriptional regulator for hemolysin
MAHAETDKLRNFGFLLKELAGRYVARFEQHASDISLTLTQCKVLVNLEKSEGVSQAKLAELTGLEPMMMVRVLDRMEADHLLERRPDPADRRARRLYLTRKAKPLLEEIWRLADVTRGEMFAGLSKADRETCLRLMERMHENMRVLEKEPSTESSTPPGAAATSRRAKVTTKAATVSSK